MRTVLLALVFVFAVSGAALPVIPFQLDPEQVVRSLRDHRAVMPAADCTALRILACHPEDPRRVKDISLRWVQLDTDDALEAIVIGEGEAERSNFAFIFDKTTTWNLVGSFSCRTNRCDVDRMIRVLQLTEDSPPLLISYQDLGGSGMVIFTNEAFHLRGGRLWPAFEVVTYDYFPLADPRMVIRRVGAYGGHLIIHTSLEKPPGSSPKNSCEVWQWDSQKFAFRPNAAARSQYCDAKSGKPIHDQPLSLLP